jgi:hypothetical protein
MASKAIKRVRKPNRAAKAPAKAVKRTVSKRAAGNSPQVPTTKTAAKKVAEVLDAPGASKAKVALLKGNNDGKPGKHAAHEPKLVRDSFTFPESEYAMFAALKKRALAAGHEVKKSEILRAGLAALTGMSDAVLIPNLAKVQRVKTGRPKKR